MVKPSKTSVSGVLLTKHITFSISEFCRACGAQEELVIRMVEEGVIDASGNEPELEFHGEALVRAQRAVRLINDLGVNFAGAALALDLLDELEQLGRPINVVSQRGR